MEVGHEERKVNNRKTEGEVLSGNLVEWIYQWNSSIARAAKRRGRSLFTRVGRASETKHTETGPLGSGLLLLEVGADHVAQRGAGARALQGRFRVRE